MAAEHQVSCEYENFAIKGAYRKGLLWTNSHDSTVRWQCQDTVTEWHGSMEFHPHTTVVKFDAKQPERENGIPELKSVVLLTGASGTLVGHDYRGRHVQMTPLAQFKRDAQSGLWTLHAEFSKESCDWVELVAE